MKKSLAGLALAAAIAIPAVLAYAHCQIPCGIYGDAMRFDMLREHITTMEKAINQIDTLSEEGDKNYNQLVRWVANKDDHAQQFTDIVTYYFMAQRVKPAGTEDEKYVDEITTLHEMMVEAMKVKQTTDTAHTDNLKQLVSEFENLYMGEEAMQHMDEHHGHSH